MVHGGREAVVNRLVVGTGEAFGERSGGGGEQGSREREKDTFNCWG